MGVVINVDLATRRAQASIESSVAVDKMCGKPFSVIFSCHTKCSARQSEKYSFSVRQTDDKLSIILKRRTHEPRKIFIYGWRFAVIGLSKRSTKLKDRGRIVDLYMYASVKCDQCLLTGMSPTVDIGVSANIECSSVAFWPSRFFHCGRQRAVAAGMSDDILDMCRADYSGRFLSSELTRCVCIFAILRPSSEAVTQTAAYGNDLEKSRIEC